MVGAAAPVVHSGMGRAATPAAPATGVFRAAQAWRNCLILKGIDAAMKI
ncbi:hypothetical protein [Thermomonas sp. LB-4]